VLRSAAGGRPCVRLRPSPPRPPPACRGSGPGPPVRRQAAAPLREEMKRASRNSPGRPVLSSACSSAPGRGRALGRAGSTYGSGAAEPRRARLSQADVGLYRRRPISEPETIASRPRRSPPWPASGTGPTIPITARTDAPPRSCSRCTPGFAASGKSSLSRPPASGLSSRASGCSACRTGYPGRWPRQARQGIEQLGHIGPWFGAATAPGNRRLLAQGEQVRPRAPPLGRAGATYRGEP